MTPHAPSSAPSFPQRECRAFTLVELLVVFGIITVLLGLLIPAITSVKGGRDITSAAYGLAGELETARNFAISNHTYTWVGFYEQDYSASSAPAAPARPRYPGAGHVTVGVVYSKDGTKLVADPTSDNASSVTLPAAGLGQVGKVVHLYGVHLAALAKPDNENSADPTKASTLQGRPYQTDLAAQGAAAIEPTLISSDSDSTSLRPFTAQSYTFYKTIRFNPRGEASVNGTLPCTRIIEVGLQPTKGGVKDPTAANVVAIQQSGIGGAVNIFRP